MMETSSSVSSNGQDRSAGLSQEIRAHLGQLLGLAYNRLPRPSPELPQRLSDLIGPLTSALAEQAERDEKAFNAEFLALMPNLKRFALSLSKSQARADDLVQDTMLKAWRSRSNYTAGTNLAAWLFTIMRNTFYSTCRKYSQEVGTGENEHANGLPVLPDQLCRLDVHDVQSAFARLPSEMREALMHVTIDNRTYEEAAILMRCRIGTVKSRVWRARERLTQLLGFGAADLGADHVTMAVMQPSSSATI